MAYEVTMPQLSQSVVEGEIVRWRVEKGDVVAVGDVLAEIVTDKVGARRQHLTKLDVGRAKRGQRTCGRWHIRVTPIPQPHKWNAQKTGDKPQRARGVISIQHNFHRAGSFQRRAGSDQPDDIVWAAHRVRVSSQNAGRRYPC